MSDTFLKFLILAFIVLTAIIVLLYDSYSFVICFSAFGIYTLIDKFVKVLIDFIIELRNKE